VRYVSDDAPPFVTDRWGLLRFPRGRSSQMGRARDVAESDPGRV